MLLPFMTTCTVRVATVEESVTTSSMLPCVPKVWQDGELISSGWVSGSEESHTM